MNKYIKKSYRFRWRDRCKLWYFYSNALFFFIYFFGSTVPLFCPPTIKPTLILVYLMTCSYENPNGKPRILSILTVDHKLGKRKRSDSVLRQMSLHQQKCQKGKMTSQTMPKKVRLHSGCGPTKDGQLELLRPPNWCG